MIHQVDSLSIAWAMGILLAGILSVCALVGMLLRGRVQGAMERAGDTQLPSAARVQAISWMSQLAARSGATHLRGRVSSLLSQLQTYDRNSAVREAAAEGLHVIEMAKTKSYDG